MKPNPNPINKTELNAFIIEKAVAAGVSEMERTTPILNQLALSVNLATCLQTRDFLDETAKEDHPMYVSIKESIEQKKQLQKMIREFLTSKLSE